MWTLRWKVEEKLLQALFAPTDWGEGEPFVQHLGHTEAGRAFLSMVHRVVEVSEGGTPSRSEGDSA